MTSVSIVIPTFNRAGLLRRCIEAALAQTHACEVLVCDHGSTDDTPGVVSGFGDRVRYLRREYDSGVHFAWLDGVISATGEYVHLNYDDDIILPTFVERCIGLMRPNVAFCFTDCETRDLETDKTIVANNFSSRIGPTGVFPSSHFIEYQISNLVSPGATLIRRQDMIDSLYVGRIPFAKYEYRGVGPDLLMTAMTCLRYPYVAFVDEPLAVFGAHGGSITVAASSNPTRIRDIRLAYDEARRYFLLTKLIQGLKLDLLSGVGLTLYRAHCRLRWRARRAWRTGLQWDIAKAPR